MTLALTAGLRYGRAFAHAERNRRAARALRRRASRLGLLPGEPPATGLTRMAFEQLEIAIALLSSENGLMSEADAVHETRKAIKRLRALLRLSEEVLGDQSVAREQDVLRDAGRRLGATRDADVLVSALDGLIERHPQKLGGRPGVVALRERLLAERDRVAALAREDRLARAEVLAQLLALRSRVAAWPAPLDAGLAPYEDGFARIYRSGRRRRRRAASASKGRALRMHRWRKRVKDLRYVSEALSRTPPAADGPAEALRARLLAVRSDGGSVKARRERCELRRLARDADRLGERLGEEHDLLLLASRVRRDGACGRGTRKALLRAIARRRRRLRRRALREGARLYERKPRPQLARVRRSFRREARA